MPRRSDPVEMVEAREKLRARFEAQQQAAAGFFDAAARANRLHAELNEVDRQQQRHAAKLAETLDVAAAADVTGWPRRRVADALKSQRPRPTASPQAGAAAHPNAEGR